jgi:hypothetical protein
LIITSGIAVWVPAKTGWPIPDGMSGRGSMITHIAGRMFTRACEDPAVAILDHCTRSLYTG